MPGAFSLLVHRGPALDASAVHRVARAVLGGHLRPDADLALFVSAPVRVDRRQRESADPLAGTVRALHVAAPPDLDCALTDLSRLVLLPRMGFPEGDAEAGWDAFGALTNDAIALELSRLTGPVAALTVLEDRALLGAYSVFGGGRRLWSAAYRPGVSYTTWDGRELLSQPMSAGDPPPPEGDYGDFPAHGLSLLFSEPLELTPSERLNVLETLTRACRPPTPGASAWRLVEGGRFSPPNDELPREEWGRFAGSLLGL